MKKIIFRGEGSRTSEKVERESDRSTTYNKKKQQRKMEIRIRTNIEMADDCTKKTVDNHLLGARCDKR